MKSGLQCYYSIAIVSASLLSKIDVVSNAVSRYQAYEINVKQMSYSSIAFMSHIRLLDD